MKEHYAGEDVITAEIEKYADMVYRICFLYLKSGADADDVFQEVFLKFFQNYSALADEKHRKAWLCRVTFNKCKDLTKSFWKRNTVGLDQIERMEAPPFDDPGQEKLIKAVWELPEGYREIIYLHYYEGYTVPEIAGLLGKNTNTVYSRMRHAREMLGKIVGRI